MTTHSVLRQYSWCAELWRNDGEFQSRQLFVFGINHRFAIWETAKFEQIANRQYIAFEYFVR